MTSIVSKEFVTRQPWSILRYNKHKYSSWVTEENYEDLQSELPVTTNRLEQGTWGIKFRSYTNLLSLQLIHDVDEYVTDRKHWNALLWNTLAWVPSETNVLTWDNYVKGSQPDDGNSRYWPSFLLCLKSVDLPQVAVWQAMRYDYITVDCNGALNVSANTAAIFTPPGDDNNNHERKKIEFRSWSGGQQEWCLLCSYQLVHC
jgi:hypothetical protein